MTMSMIEARVTETRVPAVTVMMASGEGVVRRPSLCSGRLDGFGHLGGRFCCDSMSDNTSRVGDDRWSGVYPVVEGCSGAVMCCSLT